MRPILHASRVAIALIAIHTATVHAQSDESRAGWVVRDAVIPRGATPTADGIALANGIALRPQTTLRDGVIEFDLAPAGTAFAGLAFRMQSAADYEIIYFRPTNGRWSDIQYQPVFEGETTWQLYHGDGYEGHVPANITGQMHVKIVIGGSRADVYVGGDSTPALRVRELKRPASSGGIGFWVAGGMSSDSAGGTLNALTVTPSTAIRLDALSPDTHAAGQLLRWRVSPRQPWTDSVFAPRTLPAAGQDASNWKVVDAEPSGLINLTRAIGNPAGPQRINVFGGAGWGIAFAHVTLTSPRAQTKKFYVSYSDGIGVYLNGTRLYAERNDADSRGKDYLGVVGPEVESVDLPLRAGKNELVLAITDKAFGWGFRARFENLDGISVSP